MKRSKPKRVKGSVQVTISRTYIVETDEGMDNEDIYKKAMDQFKEEWVELSPNRSDFVLLIDDYDLNIDTSHLTDY